MMPYINLIVAALGTAVAGWFAFYLSRKEEENRRRRREKQCQDAGEK